MENSLTTWNRINILYIAISFDMYPESWTHIYELGGTHGYYLLL